MKYRKKIRKTLNKRFRNIVRILHLNPTSYRPDTFHELRLDIKKLHAIFELLNYCEKDFKRKKAYRPFKEIFKKAGKVRELYVEQALLKKHKVPYTTLHNRKMNEGLRLTKEEFFKSINEQLSHDLQKGVSRTEEALSNLKNKSVDEYFKEVTQRIGHMLKQKLGESQLHRLRKYLKTFYYNLKGSNFHEEKVLFKELDIHQELLGQWHDRWVVIENIGRSLREENLDVNEIKQLKKAKAKLISESSKLLKKINKRASIEIFHT